MNYELKLLVHKMVYKLEHVLEHFYFCHVYVKTVISHQFPKNSK